MARTSTQWWAETRDDAERFAHWLGRQLVGEETAARRIREFAQQYAPDAVTRRTLDVIAGQEEQHASWVRGLLEARGVATNAEPAEKRYWQETLPSVGSFQTGAAVGAHAEKMRLERIQAIVDDEASPADVRSVFTKILKDELFHERAFREMAGPEAMEATRSSHQLGLQVLGLEA